MGQHQFPCLWYVGTLGALINASFSVPGAHELPKAAEDRRTSIDML